MMKARGKTKSAPHLHNSSTQCYGNESHKILQADDTAILEGAPNNNLALW